MTTKDTGPGPFITVRDFGPIAHAEVELRPLTVLIGANNTGKSYLALAIYSLYQAISGTSPRQRPLRPRNPYRRLWARDGSVRGFKRALGVSKSPIPQLAKLWSEESEFQNWPPAIQKWLRNESKHWAEPLSRDVNYELRRCFGTSVEQMGRRSRRIERGEFAITLGDRSTGFNWHIRSRNDELVTESWESSAPETSKNWSLGRLPPPLAGMSDPDVTDFMAHLLLMAYSDLLLADYAPPTHYLPASRTGILQGHKTLTSLIIGRVSSAWIEPMEIGRLPALSRT